MEVFAQLFKGSGFSAAAGQKSGQFDRTWNWSCT